MKKLVGQAWLRAFGWEAVGELPKAPRVVLIAYPHTSNWDLPFMLAISWVLGIRVHWMGKHTLFKPPFGGLMRVLGGIPVNRRAPEGVVGQMAEAFRTRDRLILAVSPEGTRGPVEHWKSGFYRIACAAEVPIMMGFLDYGARRGGLGPMFVPEGDPVRDMNQIREFYGGMRGKIPENARPPRLRQEDGEVSDLPG